MILAYYYFWKKSFCCALFPGVDSTVASVSQLGPLATAQYTLHEIHVDNSRSKTSTLCHLVRKFQYIWHRELVLAFCQFQMLCDQLLECKLFCYQYLQRPYQNLSAHRLHHKNHSCMSHQVLHEAKHESLLLKVPGRFIVSNT